MNQLYVSPAFAERSDGELEFLRTVDGTNGFSLFWIDIVKPLLCELKAKCLLEIGADKGAHTRYLLRYCDSFHGNLIVIEPSVTPALRQVIAGSTRVRLIAEKSYKALPLIDVAVDAALVEGDLNYYCVRSDLLAIKELSCRQNMSFPIVFVKNTSWPYARRDMYYGPDSIPDAERHEYARSGMTPWSSELEERMINYSFANAAREGGPKNGVLTAVEDFIEESGLPLRLFSLPVNHGLSIVYTERSRAEEFIRTNLLPPPALSLFLETCELARLNEVIRKLRPQQPQLQASQGFRGQIARVLRRLGQTIIGMIEG